MVDDIVTSLKNAVEHGESLESAMQLAINSGYSRKDVEEAAQYVQGGAVAYFEAKPQEKLAIPSQKKFLTNTPVIRKLPVQTFSQPVNNLENSQIQQMDFQKNNLRQDNNAIKQNIGTGMLYTQYQSESHEGFGKEIFLVIVLLILIGILISTFIFKDAILDLLSKI